MMADDEEGSGPGWYFPGCSLSVRGVVDRVEVQDEGDFEDVYLVIASGDDFEWVEVSRQIAGKKSELEALEGVAIELPVAVRPWSNGEGASLAISATHLAEARRVLE